MARPRTYDETVRRRLLEVTSQAVAEKGAPGFSLRSVAQDSGTTTAAIYTLFGSREALVAAVVEEGFARFAGHLTAVDRSEDPRADLLGLGIAYRDNALENPHFYRVMFTPVSGPAPRGRAEPTFQVLVHAVVRVAGVEPVAAEERAVRIWAYVHGLVSLELSGLLRGTREARDEAFVGALRAAGPLLAG